MFRFPKQICQYLNLKEVRGFFVYPVFKRKMSEIIMEHFKYLVFRQLLIHNIYMYQKLGK